MRIVNNLSEKFYPVNISNSVCRLTVCIQRIFEKTLTFVVKFYEKAESFLPRWERNYLTCHGKTFSDYAKEPLEKKEEPMIENQKMVYSFFSKKRSFKSLLPSRNDSFPRIAFSTHEISRDETAILKSCLKKDRLQDSKGKKVHFRDQEIARR